MNNKYKLPLVLLLLGMAITIIASLFKIMHWAGANILLPIGMLLEAIALFLLVFKILKK